MEGILRARMPQQMNRQKRSGGSRQALESRNKKRRVRNIAVIQSQRTHTSRSVKSSAAMRAKKKENVRSHVQAPAAAAVPSHGAVQARAQAVSALRARSRAIPKTRSAQVQLPAITGVIAGLGMLLCIGLLIVTLVGYNKLSSLNGEMVSLRNEIGSLEAQNGTLLLELRPYTEETRIERLAKMRLHMSYPDEQTRRVLVSTPVLRKSGTQKALEEMGGSQGSASTDLATAMTPQALMQNTLSHTIFSPLSMAQQWVVQQAISMEAVGE